MKSFFVSLILIAAIALSCSYSDEEKKQAKQLYDNVLLSVSEIVVADSSYAKCLQYLMREMQKPLLKRDKEARKQVEDSAVVLLQRYDSLMVVIGKACARIDTATFFDEETDILSPAKGLCAAYNEVSLKEYKDICDQISAFKYPVTDAEYTEILSLTFTADSVLNEKVFALNEVMKQFAEKYDLIPEEE